MKDEEAKRELEEAKRDLQSKIDDMKDDVQNMCKGTISAFLWPELAARSFRTLPRFC